MAKIILLEFLTIHGDGWIKSDGIIYVLIEFDLTKETIFLF